MKYAPRKVYIKESGGYVELSYTDFCRRRQADKRLIHPIILRATGWGVESPRLFLAGGKRDGI